MTTMEIRPEARRPTPAGPRFVGVRANLMPPEVLTRRRIDRIRKRVLIALGVVVALVLLAFLGAWMQTRSAQSDLDGLNHQISQQQAEQNSFATLAQVQQQVQTTRSELATLMTGDLQWPGLLAALSSATPHGTVLTNVAATLTRSTAGSAAAGSAANPLIASGTDVVGTLTISGSSATPDDVATFADHLAAIKGVTGVQVTSVGGTGAAAGGGVSFNVTASLTGSILGGRFTPTKAGN